MEKKIDLIKKYKLQKMTKFINKNKNKNVEFKNLIL